MPLPSNNPTLVIIHDGFSLYGVVTTAGAKDTSSVSVPITELSDTLGQVVAQLGRPKQVILVTTDITIATLQLPPGLENMTDGDELNKMLNWEMQPYLELNPMTPMLGQILVAQDHLSHQQLRDLVEAQKQQRADNPAAATIPLGELAIERGFIEQEDLNGAVSLQIASTTENTGEYVFGLPASEQAIPNQNQQRHITAMTREDRSKWLSAFKKNGLSIDAMLPIVGIAAGEIASSNTSSVSTVIEVHNTFASITHFTGNKASAFEYRPLPISPADTDQIRNLINRINSPSKLLKCATGELTELVHATGETNTPTVQLDTSTKSLMESIAIGAIATVARPASGIASVPIKDPPIPLNQRAFYKPLLASICITGLIIAAEFFMARSLLPIIAERDKQEKADLDAHDKMDEVNELKDRIGILDSEIDALNAEIAPIQKRNRLIGNSLGKRSDFHSTLFEVVAAAVGDEVMLDRLSSRNGHIFQVEAWALTQEKADLFVKQLADALASHSMTVLVESTRTAAGRLNLEGRQVVLRITPITVPVVLTNEGIGE